MTKKSSFLRQLNLYGFNRLSGAGPNQGSYYHEKFLRGMKFLCRRMQRQKVNGNGIRAAGNPDEEPNLTLYPPCPPVRTFSQHSSLIAQTQPVVSTFVPTVRDIVPSTNIDRPSRSGKIESPTKKKKREQEEAVPDDEHSVPPTSPSPQNGPTVSFPLKLQCILDKLEADGTTDIVSWLSHGRAFLVSDPTRFVDELMPLYFNQSKYSSFQRQLHMYNFQRITAPGPDKVCSSLARSGNYSCFYLLVLIHLFFVTPYILLHVRQQGAYHHPNFLRGRPELALKMRRTRVNGNGTRKPGNPETEPDFYRVQAMPHIAEGTIIDIPLDHPTSKGHGNKDMVSLQSEDDVSFRTEDDDGQ